MPYTNVKPGAKADAAHSEGIWSLFWTSDNLFTGSLDGTIKKWQEKSNLSLVSTSQPQKFGVTSVTSVSDGSLAIAAFQNGVIRFYDTSNMSEVSKIEPGILESWSICLSPSDDVLASGTSKGSINIYSMQDNHECVATLMTESKMILSSSFSSDAKLVSSSIDGMVNLFDVSTQTILHSMKAHHMPIKSVTFSNDSKLIYTASDDCHIGVYDVNSGKCIKLFSHRNMVYSVDTSLDHRHFISGCADGTVHVWDLGMQCKIQSFETHQNNVWSVCYCKSNNSSLHMNKFASVGGDALLQIYQ